MNRSTVGCQLANNVKPHAPSVPGEDVKAFGFRKLGTNPIRMRFRIIDCRVVNRGDFLGKLFSDDLKTQQQFLLDMVD